MIYSGCKRIQILHLDLTTKCNLNCIYCFVKRNDFVSNSSKELPIINSNQWLEIINQASLMGIKKIIFSGGEPLLYSNFVEIFKRTNVFAKEIVIFTNLTKHCTNNLLQILRNLKSKLIIITSIDGLQSHSINRPVSNIEEIIKNIKLIHSKNKNVKIIINTVVTKYNINEIPQLIPLLKEIGINKWRLDFPLKPKNLKIMPPPKRIYSFDENINKREI